MGIADLTSANRNKRTICLPFSQDNYDRIYFDEDFACNQFGFEKHFNNEQACRDYLDHIKWPDGFRCRNCDHTKYWISAKGLYICTRCESPNSLRAGTVMHGTKKPLTYWFRAMWWFTTRKSGVNAINLINWPGLGSYHKHGLFPSHRRIVNFINYPKLLVLAPVFGVASTATDFEYATLDAP